MAEWQGFEPWSPVSLAKRFSRPPHSTALPPLHENPEAKTPGFNVLTRALKPGGEAGIRTPDTLLAHTRFPIVLLRPARTPLRGFMRV